jgi:hypothetical protein
VSQVGWFRKSIRREAERGTPPVANEGGSVGVTEITGRQAAQAVADAVASDPMVRMGDRCQRLVAQQKPLGPDESEYCGATGYTNGQVYAMMAGTQSAEEIFGPHLARDDAQRASNAMSALGVVATAERAMYFFIGAVAYLERQYGVKPERE